MKKALFSLVPFLCPAFSTSGAAQNSRTVMFRTICLEQVENLPGVAVPAQDPETMQKVPLYTSDFSEVIAGTFSGEEAVFYAPDSGADGEPVPVARGPLAKAARQLFIFLPSGEGKDKPPYRVLAYDDDTGSFSLGFIRAVNLSPVPVRFVVAGAVSPQIPPSKHALFPQPKQTNDYHMYPVVIEFLSGDGKWVKGQSTSWKANDRKRETVITLINRKFRQPEVKAYTDFPPWLEPQP